ncbi:ABC transporter ATP-binding protein [Slackia heliotrinireducens]|uniref:ABC transporter ATP-binding protein n=1 Tax=Slackia heliotrinireducens TaxID=84110 RepID=UPI0033155CA1
MNDIVVEDLSFAYEGTDRLILNGINMKINRGDFVCLLGQSGCGKSTFLRLLAGLEKATTGSIKMDGQEITGADLDRSVVFQDYGLFPWMTAGDNILLALRQRYPKRKKSELQKIALDVLQDVGLKPDVYKKYPKELSGGMQQRCAIARSFSIDPPVMLMDEPFGALDAVTRAKLQDMLLNLWSHEDQHKTVFFVTHDVEEALLLATRIFVFGQSPSKIIFEHSVKPEERPTRANLYTSEPVAKLREALIANINQDVMSHIE